MRRTVALIAGACALLLASCTQPKPIWREMLSKSISEFTYPIRDNNTDRVWIKNTADSECNRGCQAGVGTCCKGGGGGEGVVAVLPGGGGGGFFSGLFGGGAKDALAGPPGQGSPLDGLAVEVFSNYITQKKKGRVIEGHRHNYATDFGAETRTKIDLSQDGKSTGHMLSCEDLCILDEAKKRRADKVLVYQILEFKLDELLIHFRYSDVRSGVVELSRTLKVEGLSISDRSF